MILFLEKSEEDIIRQSHGHLFSVTEGRIEEWCLLCLLISILVLAN